MRAASAGPRARAAARVCGAEGQVSGSRAQQQARRRQRGERERGPRAPAAAQDRALQAQPGRFESGRCAGPSRRGLQSVHGPAGRARAHRLDVSRAHQQQLGEISPGRCTRAKSTLTSTPRRGSIPPAGRPDCRGRPGGPARLAVCAPEHRALHFDAPHPGAGEEQSDSGLHRAPRGRLWEQRRRRARRPEGGVRAILLDAEARDEVGTANAGRLKGALLKAVALVRAVGGSVAPTNQRVWPFTRRSRTPLTSNSVFGFLFAALPRVALLGDRAGVSNLWSE